MSDLDPNVDPNVDPNIRNQPASTAQPMPEPRRELEIPAGEQMYKFDGNVQSVPGWIDKGWAGYDRGPALHVPQGPAIGNEGPYTTKTARMGDTIVFRPAEGATPAHYDVLKGEVTPEEGGTKKPPQASQASLEDMVRTGVLSVDELGEDAKAQVVARSPSLKRVVEGDAPAPEVQELPLKLS